MKNDQPKQLVKDVKAFILSYGSYRKAHAELEKHDKGFSASFLCGVVGNKYKITERLANLAGWRLIKTWVKDA